MSNHYVLKMTDKMYPEQLKLIKDAPQILYAIGDINLLNNNSIAIVGSRNCTEYGSMHANKFAQEISKAGITVISGLAKRNRYSSTYWSNEEQRKNNCSDRRRVS